MRRQIAKQMEEAQALKALKQQEQELARQHDRETSLKHHESLKQEQMAARMRKRQQGTEYRQSLKDQVDEKGRLEYI